MSTAALARSAFGVCMLFSVLCAAHSQDFQRSLQQAEGAHRPRNMSPTATTRWYVYGWRPRSGHVRWLHAPPCAKGLASGLQDDRVLLSLMADVHMPACVRGPTCRPGMHVSRAAQCRWIAHVPHCMWSCMVKAARSAAFSMPCAAPGTTSAQMRSRGWCSTGRNAPSLR